MFDIVTVEGGIGLLVGWKRAGWKGAAVGYGVGTALAATIAPVSMALDAFTAATGFGALPDASAATSPTATGSTSSAPKGLAKGSKGQDVRDLQTKLNQATSAALVVDGDFGPGTDKALRAFQTAHKLPVTGVADAATLAELSTQAKLKAIDYTSDVTEDVAENANIPPKYR